jgi:uncharacterized membrane protein
MRFKNRKDDISINSKVLVLTDPLNINLNDITEGLIKFGVFVAIIATFVIQWRLGLRLNPEFEICDVITSDIVKGCMVLRDYCIRFFI